LTGLVINKAILNG